MMIAPRCGIEEGILMINETLRAYVFPPVTRLTTGASSTRGASCLTSCRSCGATSASSAAPDPPRYNPHRTFAHVRLRAHPFWLPRERAGAELIRPSRSPPGAATALVGFCARACLPLRAFTGRVSPRVPRVRLSSHACAYPCVPCVGTFASTLLRSRSLSGTTQTFPCV